MEFSIKKVAEMYVAERFPKASKEEQEKIVRDWTHKIKDSEALVRDFKNRVGDPYGKCILDVGSGPGGVSIAFALAGAQVTGIDIEKELHDISKNHAAIYNVPVNFVLYDGSKLPFENESFDYAVSVSVIEHVTNPVYYLSEIYRVLKPGGIVYLGFPNKLAFKETHTQIWFLTYVPAFMRDWVVKVLHRNPLEANNLHFYTYFDLCRMLHQFSPTFTIVKEEGVSTNPIKKIVRSILSLIGIPYKAVLPHILVLLRK